MAIGEEFGQEKGQLDDSIRTVSKAPDSVAVLLKEDEACQIELEGESCMPIDAGYNELYSAQGEEWENKESKVKKWLKRICPNLLMKIKDLCVSGCERFVRRSRFFSLSGWFIKSGRMLWHWLILGLLRWLIHQLLCFLFLWCFCWPICWLFQWLPESLKASMANSVSESFADQLNKLLP